MGKTDVERQHINVEKMKMLGATVIPVTSGNMTLKDATNEAIRDWCCHPADTYYIIGSTVGPHPYPDMVARLQSVISEEIRKQLLEKEGRECPDYLIACVGGGSNAAGTIYHYIDNPSVQIVLAEAGGKGVETGMTAATIALGKMGIIHALAQSSTGIIAEFKRKSPSKGWIKESASPEIIIPGYQATGASVLSILTDETFFGGSLRDIRVARPLADIPILRKDFIIDEYQLLQACIVEADAVLLIAAWDILSIDYKSIAYVLWRVMNYFQ